MTITARDAYDPYLGRVGIGKCLKCKGSVHNYRYDRFRTLAVYRDGRLIGYCHQACYEEWNPIVGRCNSCEKVLRQQGGHRRRARGIYCIKCLRKIEKERELERQRRIEFVKKNAKPIIKKVAKVAIYSAPVAREITVCYKTANILYSSWNIIYQAYQTSDTRTLKRDAYCVAGDGLKTGLASYQSDYIWDKIEDKVPENIKYESRMIIFGLLSSVSKEEISLVENALRYI